MTNVNSKPARGFRLLLVFAVVSLLAGAVFLFARPDQLERARRARQQGHTDLARTAYAAHLSAHPDDDDARFELAQMLTKHAPRAALEHFDRIAPPSPKYPDALRRRAGILLETGADEPAKAALLALEELEQDDFAVQFALAEIEFRARRFEDALRRAKASEALRPNEPRALLLIADCLDELHREAEMVDPLQSVVDRDPENYAARLNLAYALQHAGRPEQAERELRWCLQRKPRDVAALRLLGSVKRELGEPEAALAIVQSALKVAPDDLDLRILEGQLLLSLQQSQLAYQRLQPLMQSAPTNRQLLALLARAATLAGDRDNAEEYRRALAEQIEREIER